MSNQIERKEIEDVQRILSQLFPLLEQAENNFKSARNWGILDIFGGGMIVDLIKHSKINSAGNCMSQISFLLKDLQRELKDVYIPSDFQMETGTFATFADFVFDGILADIYMQSKINRSLEEIQELMRRLRILQDKMNELKNRC